MGPLTCLFCCRFFFVVRYSRESHVWGNPHRAGQSRLLRNERDRAGHYENQIHVQDCPSLCVFCGSWHNWPFLCPPSLHQNGGCRLSYNRQAQCHGSDVAFLSVFFLLFKTAPHKGSGVWVCLLSHGVPVPLKATAFCLFGRILSKAASTAPMGMAGTPRTSRPWSEDR